MLDKNHMFWYCIETFLRVYLYMGISGATSEQSQLDSAETARAIWGANDTSAPGGFLLL